MLTGVEGRNVDNGCRCGLRSLEGEQVGEWDTAPPRHPKARRIGCNDPEHYYGSLPVAYVVLLRGSAPGAVDAGETLNQRRDLPRRLSFLLQVNKPTKAAAGSGPGTVDRFSTVIEFQMYWRVPSPKSISPLPLQFWS